MIKTLSPYYVSIPLVNPVTTVVCESYTINLFIWSGNKTSVPSQPEYQRTKVNAAASNGTDKVNISRLINDFIDFNAEPSLVTSLENSNNQVWVRFYVTYNDLPSTPQLQFVQLAVKGYGYFKEGENPDTPTNKVLMNVNEYKVNRNGYFVYPIELDETPPPAPSITITDVINIGGGEVELHFTSVGTYPSMHLLIDEIGDPIDVELDFSEPVSPLVLTALIPEDPTDFEFTLSGFDIVSNTTATSNIFEKTLP